MRGRSLLLVILASAGALAGCGGGGGGATTGATLDDAGDASADGSGLTDAGYEAWEAAYEASDTGYEASADATTDGMVEGGTDANVEASPDASDGAVSCGWTPYNDGLSGGAVVDVLFDTRTQPPSLYATVGSSLYKSADNGATWTTQGTFASGTIAFLAAPTNNASLLLASSSAGVIESMDSGQTWSLIAFENVAVRTIAAAASQPLRVYAGVTGGGLYRSDDQGSSWAAMNQGYPYVDTLAVDVAPDDPDDVVAGGPVLTSQGGWGTSGVVVRSTDGGRSWNAVIPSAGLVYNVRRCSVDPTVLYAATSTGLAKSTDRGATWTVTPLADQVEDVTITPGACDDVYAMVYGVGPEHSTDGGQHFGAALTQGLNLVTPGSWPGRMAIVQTGSADAGAADAGSADAGSGDQVVVLGSHGGIWHTTNGGAQWSTGQGILGMSLRSLAASPLDPGRLWLSSWGSGVWQRASSSASWQRVPTTALPVDYVFSAAPDPHTADRVLVGAGTLYESVDDGVTFNPASVAANEFGFGFDPTNANVLYAVTQTHGVYQSTNGGTSWATINGNLTAWATAAGNFIDVESIVVDPSATQTLYVGTNGKGVQKTTNGGGSWTNVLTPNGQIACLLLVPGSPSTLYACVSGSGIRSSTDGGSTWTDVSQGLPSLNVGGLAYDATGGGLYAVSKGVYVRFPGQSWTGVDVGCTPAGGATTPAILVSGSQRSVVVGAGGGVYAHAI